MPFTVRSKFFYTPVSLTFLKKYDSCRPGTNVEKDLKKKPLVPGTKHIQAHIPVLLLVDLIKIKLHLKTLKTLKAASFGNSVR